MAAKFLKGFGHKLFKFVGQEVRNLSSFRQRNQQNKGYNYNYYHHSYRPNTFLLASGLPIILNLDTNNDQGFSANRNQNHTNNNNNNRGSSRKRNYSKAFLNKPKIDGSPAKKKRKHSRKDIQGKIKWKIITFMYENKNLTAKAVQNQKQFYNILKDTPLNTIRKWKSMYPEGSQKLDNLQHMDKKRDKKRIPAFPKIEEELMRQRKERVERNRDRSRKWLIRSTSKLINDKEKLKQLQLDDLEKKNLETFSISGGWIDKVIDRNDLKSRSISSNRRMTPEEYLKLRIEYLPKERAQLTTIGIINNGIWDKSRVLDIDEVPVVLSKQKRHQLVAEGENISVVPPPITTHDKYRDGTIVPVIGYGYILFAVAIVKGGSTVAKEMPMFNNMYGDWLYCCCNGKAYMNNPLWQEVMCQIERRTREKRGCNFLGMNAQESIAVYNDNCGSHSTDKQKEKLEAKLIFLRQLLEEATHIQQPVDQHVGVYIQGKMQNDYDDMVDEIFDEIDAGDRDEDDRIGAKTMRAKFFEFGYNAIKAVSKCTHLLERSWVNFGIDIQDPRKDGDISTLHIDGRKSKRQVVNLFEENNDEKMCEFLDMTLQDCDTSSLNSYDRNHNRNHNSNRNISENIEDISITEDDEDVLVGLCGSNDMNCIQIDTNILNDNDTQYKYDVDNDINIAQSIQIINDKEIGMEEDNIKPKKQKYKRKFSFKNTIYKKKRNENHEHNDVYNSNLNHMLDGLNAKQMREILQKQIKEQKLNAKDIQM